MRESLKYPLAIFFLLLLVTLLFWINRPEKREPENTHNHMAPKEKTECIECLERDSKKRLKLLKSTRYLEKYIENVIKKGSAQKLGFAYGDMQGGFADSAAAPKIAAYVVSLAGRKPTHPEWIKEGGTFYVSNCGGCHGEDGKGINGTFPDLTRDPLLGIERRIERELEAQASQ